MRSDRSKVNDTKAAPNAEELNAAKLAMKPGWELEERWNRIQVGRQGSYSIERVESLNYYCKTTSRTRVILICILTPLPALCLALLLECIPLSSPSEGWQANWMFWIRLSLMVFLLNLSFIFQLNLFVPGINVTFAKIWVASIGASVAFMGIDVILASTVGFPVPFVVQIGGSSMSIFIPLVIRLVLGKEPYANSSPHRPHIQRFYRFIMVYIMLVAGFPFYKVLYDQLPEKCQGCAIVILPMWKFAAKHLIIRASRELEDFIPETVALSADFVSSLFVTVCVSTSDSLYLTAAFIMADLAQSMLEFREVQANANVVVNLHRERRQSKEYLGIKRHGGESANDGLLTTMLAVTRNPSSFNIRSLSSTRLRACLPHPITRDQANTLRDLENSGVYVFNRSTRSSVLVSQRKIRVSSSLIAPGPSDSALRADSDSAEIERERVEKSKQLIVQGLQLLFHCEYLALVEYVECIVPLIYVIYKSVLEQLPNIDYFPGGAGNWGTQAIVNVLVSAILEIGSLILLNLVLQRKFSFSPMYQLAFVLETQIITVQAKLFLTSLVLLQYQLEHLGADFTFHFQWLQDSNQ